MDNEEKTISFERFNPLIDVSALSAATIVIIGLGRAGLSVLKQIIQLPFSRVVAIDFDTVSDRERGTLFPFGCRERHKAHAAGEIVRFWRPDIKFTPVLMRINHETRGRLAKIVETSSVTFWCADDFQALINSSEILHSKPCVGMAFAEQGAYAEIAWSLPGLTPCLACSLDAHERRSEGGAASLPVDVESAVNVAIGCALGLLLRGRHGFGLFEELLAADCPLLAAHNRVNAFTRSSNDLVPQLTKLIPVSRRCNVCSRREV